MGAAMAMATAATADAEAEAAPRGVGFEAWPLALHELQIHGAHEHEHEDEEGISYGALEELGLSFDPADLAEIVGVAYQADVQD